MWGFIRLRHVLYKCSRTLPHVTVPAPWQGRTKAITTTSVVGVTIDLENQSNIITIYGCHHETGRGGETHAGLAPVPTCYNTSTHTQ